MNGLNFKATIDTKPGDDAMGALYTKYQGRFEKKGFNLNLKTGNLPLGRITGDFDKFSGSLDAATARVLAFTATTTVVYGLATAFNRLFTDSIKLEKQLAGIQAILQTSNSNLQKFSSELFKVANATGQSFDVAATAASEFARQGLSVEETLKATNAALAFSKIAGTDAAQTVENLTAALNTFANEALTYTDVLDTIVSLDNAFAISAAGISDGLKRVGSVASESGIQLKEIASLIAVVQQVSARGAPVISNGLKTIFTRLSRTNVQQTLNSIGVTTQNSNGEFRSQIEVLTDLANKLDTLSDRQRAFVLEQVAGVYQINTLQATLKSLSGEYSLFDKAVKVASDSSGNAAERLKILTDTTDANLQKLKNNLTQFLAETGKATVKPILDNFVGIGNKILETLNLGAATEGGEKAGFSIGKVLLNGISSALAGPGSVLLVVTITRLLAKITKDAFTAVQTLAGLKKASLVDEKVQMSVNRAIEMGNKALVSRLATTTSLVEKARILQTLMADMDRKLAMAQVRQAVATGLAANNRKGGPRGTGKAAGYIPNFSKGFIPNFSKGAIPKPLEELEKKTARSKTYEPGKVVPAPNGGVMSTAETVTGMEYKGKKDFVISPPQYSIAGRDHAKDFKKQYGVNIYDFIGKKNVAAKGFIPNFLDPEYIEQRKAERIPKAQRTPEQQAVRDTNAAEVRRGRKELVNIGDFAGGKVYNEKAEEQFRIALKNRNVEWDDKITNVGFEVIEIDVGEDRPQKTLPDGSKKNASTNFKNSIVKKPKGDITNLTNKFEAFAIRQLNKRKDRDFNFQKARLTAFGAGNSAVDGYSINPAKNSIDLLEVKSGDWKTPSDISNKIGRFVPENIVTLGKPIESLFKESNRAPYSFDTIKLRNILAVPKITKQKFAGSPKKELIDKKWTSILNYKGEKPSVIAKNLNLVPVTKQDVRRQFGGNANASTPSFTFKNGRLVPVAAAKNPTAKQQYQNTLKAIAGQAKGMKLRAEGFIPNFSSPFSPPEPSYAEQMKAQKIAVNAEMSSGFERRDVKIGISNDAKTPLNPQGLAVYNKEEGTLSKGVSYAKMAKIDPATKRTYGDDLGEGTAISAFGFIPNFATPKEKRAQKRAERAQRKKEQREKAANLKPTRVLPSSPSDRTGSTWRRGSNNRYSGPNTPTNYFSSPPGSSVQTSTGSSQPVPSKPAIPIPKPETRLDFPKYSPIPAPKPETRISIPKPETRISVPENRLGSPRYSPVSGSQRGNATPNYPRLSNGVDVDNLKSAKGTVVGSKQFNGPGMNPFGNKNPSFIPSGPTIPMSGPLQKKPKQPKVPKPKKIDPARGMGLATAAAFAIPTLTGMLSTPAEGEEQTKGQKIAQGTGEALGAGIAAASVALMIPALAPLAPAIGLGVAAFKGLKSVSEASIPSLSNLKKENDKLVQSSESQTNSLTEAVKAQDELSQLKESGADPRKIANAQLKFAKSLSGIKDTNLVSTLTNEKDDVKKQEAIVTYQEKINKDLKFSQSNLATQTIIQQSQKENSSFLDPIMGRKTKTKDFKAEDFSLYLDPIIESLDFTKDTTGKAAEGLKEVANGTKTFGDFISKFGETLGMSQAQVKLATETYNGLSKEFKGDSLRALDRSGAAAANYNKNLKESIVAEKPTFNIDIQGVFDKALKSLTLDTALINYKNFASAGTNLDIEKNRLNLESQSGRITETATTNRAADLQIKELKLETDKKGTQLISDAVDDLIKIIPKETSTEQKSNILNQANAVLRGGGDISSLENAIKQTLDSSDKSKEVLTQIANISQQTVEGIERLRIDQSEGTRSINVIAQDQLREAEKRNKEEIGRSALAGPPQYANKLMDTGAVIETDAKIQKLRSKAERSGGAKTEQGRKLLLEASNLEMQNDRIKSKDEQAQAERYGKENVVKRTDAERSGMAQIQKNMAEDIGQKLKDLNTTRGKSGKSSIFSSQDIKKITDGIQIGGEGATESRRMLEEKLNNPNYAQDSTVQSFAREIKSVGGSNSIFANNSQMPAVSGANVPIAASAGVAGAGFPTVPSAAGAGAPTVPSVATGGSGVPMIPSAAGAGAPTVPSVATGGSGAQMALGSAQLPTGQSFTSGSMPRNQAAETIQRIADTEKNNKDYKDFEAEKERNRKLKQQRDVLNATPKTVLDSNIKAAQSVSEILPTKKGNRGGVINSLGTDDQELNDFKRRLQTDLVTETDFENLKGSVNVTKDGKARPKSDSTRRQAFVDQVKNSGYVFQEDLASVERKIASTQANRQKKLAEGKTTEQEDADLKGLEERKANLKLDPAKLEEEIKRSDEDLIKRQEALKPVIAGVESMANGTSYSKGLAERLMGGPKRPAIKEIKQPENFDVASSMTDIEKARQEKEALDKEMESNASTIKEMEASRSSESTPEQDKALVDARNKQKELMAKRDAANAKIKEGETAMGKAPKATQGYLEQQKNAIIPDTYFEDKQIEAAKTSIEYGKGVGRYTPEKMAEEEKKLAEATSRKEAKRGKAQSTEGYDVAISRLRDELANGRTKMGTQGSLKGVFTKTALTEDEKVKTQAAIAELETVKKGIEESNAKITQYDQGIAQADQAFLTQSPVDYYKTAQTQMMGIKPATDLEDQQIRAAETSIAYGKAGGKYTPERLAEEEKKLAEAKARKEAKAGKVQSTKPYDTMIASLEDQLTNGTKTIGAKGEVKRTALTEDEKVKTQETLAKVKKDKANVETQNAQIVQLQGKQDQAKRRLKFSDPQAYLKILNEEEALPNAKDEKARQEEIKSAQDRASRLDPVKMQTANINKLKGSKDPNLQAVGAQMESISQKELELKTLEGSDSSEEGKKKAAELKAQIEAEKQKLGVAYDQNRGAIDQTLYKDQVAPMLAEQMQNPEDQLKVAEFNDKVQERQAKEAELDPVNKKIAEIDAKEKERRAVAKEALAAVPAGDPKYDEKFAAYQKFSRGEITAEEANTQSGGQLKAAFDRVSKNRMNKQAADQAKADLSTSGDTVEERFRKKEIYAKFSRGEITQEEADKQTGGGIKAAYAKVKPNQDAGKFEDLNNVGNVKEQEARKAELEKQVEKTKQEENALGAAIKPLVDAVTGLTNAQTATAEGAAAGKTPEGTAPTPGAEGGEKTIASTSTVNVSVTGGSLSDPQIVELKNGLIAEIKTIIGQAILASTGKPPNFGPPETTAVA
jgi:TP901 family phage tail tape measure protein